MSSILVSIIIPCYNVEDYVAEALDSAINQTYHPIEIIAVDNNSTDMTLDILRDYKRRYPDLITVLEEKKQGAPAARNKGLSVAKGEWLQFLDADDLLSVGKIENQIHLIKHSTKECVQVVGNFKQQFITGVQINENSGLYNNPILDIAFTALGQTTANLYQKLALINVGGWDTNLRNAQDLDLGCRLLIYNLHGVIYDSSFNTIYRMREFGQITSSNIESIHLTTILVRCRFYYLLEIKYPSIFKEKFSLLNDMLYYPIYHLGIYDVKIAHEYLVKYLGKDFYPSPRINYIAKHNSLGVRFFGFLRYMTIRRVVRKIFIRIAGENRYSNLRFRERFKGQIDINSQLAN